MTCESANGKALSGPGTVQVLCCTFRENGYYALRLKDRVIDVRRCEWSDQRMGIDVYALDDVNIDFTVDDPRFFNRIFYGRVTAMHKEFYQ
ncbi:hypothetical protein F9L00_19045 [Brucella anthropi]|uniref:Uncharacterized protein n=1 Tax=Brucella anthropi TaxID=529 RepID=A0A6L3Z3J7_BRUAN|nr:hypothetical protein [Brucella anthropi]KAB2766826.1 hypothetical protein F9L04_16280 [Brucella anthropi]KAB2774671.1 hypothetical protein F9L00_19045 [Brucella anthropi]